MLQFLKTSDSVPEQPKDEFPEADWLDDDNFVELLQDDDPDAPWPKKPKLL